MTIDDKSDYGEEAGFRREARDAEDDEYLDNFRRRNASSSSAAAFTAHDGGLFESAFKGGFIERADALIFMGGPGMDMRGSRRWTPEAAAELARLMNLVNDAYSDADFEENTRADPQANFETRQSATLGHYLFWGRNLFPKWRKPKQHEDPRNLNKKFEKEAKAVKRAEDSLFLERLLAKEPLPAKEQQPTTHHHSLPTRKSVTFLLENYSSKESKQSKESKEAEEFVDPSSAKKRARTWLRLPGLPGGSSFTTVAGRKENEDPNERGLRGNWHGGRLKGLVRRLTGTGAGKDR